MEEKDLKNLTLLLSNNSAVFLFDMLKEQEEQARKALMSSEVEEDNKKIIKLTSKFNTITDIIEKLERIQKGKYSSVEETLTDTEEDIYKIRVGEGNDSV